MGVSFNPPNASVITSLRKCKTLPRSCIWRESYSAEEDFDCKDILPRHFLSLRCTKKLIVKRLTSKIIYLDPKVKLYVVNLRLNEATSSPISPLSSGQDSDTALAKGEEAAGLLQPERAKYVR
jgi:hypothetical protein